MPVSPKQFWLWITVVVIASMTSGGLLAAEDASTVEIEFFERHIRPIFAEVCQTCHNADAAESGLRLTDRQSLLQGGDRGPAVVPGKPEGSLLLSAVRYRTQLQMPPKSRLSNTQIENIRRWIAAGAVWPASKSSSAATAVVDDGFPTERQRRWWAFQPVRDPRLPITDMNWGHNAVDRFIAKQLEVQGLHPAPAADRRTLIRRATLDLTGLLPTPWETNAFLHDASPAAYARLVDRLLASPTYGQRWGRHWLDVARYADYYQADPTEHSASNYFELLQAWRYRDWVVKALNDDMPYQDFVKYQIAGDLIPSPVGHEVHVDGLVATTFLSIGNWNHSEASKEKLVSDVVDDQIDTIGKAFLGLTLGCARCHEHKFDPVSQEDYYALAGIFYSTRVISNLNDLGTATSINRVPLVSSDELARFKAQAQPAEIPVALAVQEGGTPGGLFPGIQDVPIHIRGSFTKLGRVVPRRLPNYLAGEHQVSIGSGSGRRELAGWIASENNTLAARVIVNRVWQWHFGEGIVRTPSNFGTLSPPPSHPQLLDWLAVRFVQDGWSLKAFHRRIMLSASYCQSSVTSTEFVKLDPQNRWLAHFRARRMESEAIRDVMMSAAGQLEMEMGGPARRDPLLPRRSLYVQTTRWDRNNFSTMFDAANPDASVEKRIVSTVAPQALLLLNGKFIHSIAKQFAARLLRDVPDNNRKRMELAYHLLYGRPIRDEEAEVLQQLLTESTAVSEQRAWDDIAHVLLCANELVTLD